MLFNLIATAATLMIVGMDVGTVVGVTVANISSVGAAVGRSDSKGWCWYQIVDLHTFAFDNNLS